MYFGILKVERTFTLTSIEVNDDLKSFVFHYRSMCYGAMITRKDAWLESGMVYCLVEWNCVYLVVGVLFSGMEKNAGDWAS